MIAYTNSTAEDVQASQELKLKGNELRQQFELLNNLLDKIYSAHSLPTLLYKAVDTPASLQIPGTPLFYCSVTPAMLDHLITHGLSPKERDRILDNLKAMAPSGVTPEVLRVLTTVHLNRKSIFNFLPSLNFILSVPVRHQEELLRALWVGEKTVNSQRIGLEQERVLLHLFASRLGVTIKYLDIERQTSERFEQARKTSRDAEALYEITKLAVSSLELKFPDLAAFTKTS